MEVCAISPGNRFLIQGLGLSSEEMPVLDFTQLKNTRYNFYGKVNQQDLEQSLRNHIASNYSFHPEWGVECTGLSLEGDDVEVTLNNGGQIELVRPRFVVGADGVHSVVRKHSKLEMQRDGKVNDKTTGDDHFTMSMMDVPLDGYDGDDSWVNYHFSGDDFMLITKLPDGNHRVYVSGAMEKELLKTDDHAAVFQRGLDQFSPGATLRYPKKATSWKIFNSIADDYRKGPVFLCGDACHVRSPAGGQGANCCMQDAFNLGWKLASVIQRSSPNPILESYAAERKPVTQLVQGFAESIHNVVFDRSRTLEERVKNTRSKEWQKECINGISGLAHHYRESIWRPEGCAELDEGPRIGERAPNALLSTEPKRWLHEVYRHTKATLLLQPSNSDELEQAKKIMANVVQSYRTSIKPVIIYHHSPDGVSMDNWALSTTDEFSKWYGSSQSGGRFHLVRPDLYVGLAGTFDSIEELNQYLDHWYMEESRSGG